MARSQNSVRITVSLPDGDHADLLDTAEQHDVSLPWLARRAVEKHLTRSLALSKDVNDSTSIAAIGVATHEAGHAIQHAAHYAPLWLRKYPRAHGQHRLVNRLRRDDDRAVHGVAVAGGHRRAPVLRGPPLPDRDAPGGV